VYIISKLNDGYQPGISKLTLMHNQQLVPNFFDNQIIGTQFFNIDIDNLAGTHLFLILKIKNLFKKIKIKIKTYSVVRK
jgi:hypothetical protein